MSNTVLRTLSSSFVKVRRTNSTDASFPTRIPRLAVSAGADNAPSGIGDAAAQTTLAVFDLVPPHQPAPHLHPRPLFNAPADNVVILIPFGIGSDTNTMKMRVIGWRMAFDRGAEQSLYGAAVGDALWIPVTLGEFLCTLSTPAGVAQSIIGSTNLFADTIAIQGTSGNDDIDVSITSPADNTIAHVVLDAKGFQKLEVTFDRNSSATSCNALIARY